MKMAASLLLVFIAASFPRGEVSPVYESAAFSEGVEPVVVALKDIRQERSAGTFEEDVHDEEWEFYKSRLAKQDFRPRFGSKHSLQKDEAQSSAAGYPVLKTSFAGIPNVTRGQPDSMITVGPNHVMLAVNTDVAIYTKDGTKLFQTSFAEWFFSITKGSITNLYDPKLVYDQYSGHYIFLCDSRRSDGRSWYLFSVSKTSDPTQDWAFWLLDMGLNGTVKGETLWADLPRIGIDERAIYLTGNMTTFRTYQFRYAKLRVLRKNQVYRFGKITWRDFWKLRDESGALSFSIEPAHSYGPAPQEYMVNTSPAGGNSITLWTVRKGGTANPVLSRATIGVSDYYLPPSAIQKGGGAKLATRECGVYNVVANGSSIYTAHNTGFDWGGGLVSAVRFYEINPSGSLVQEITYGKNNLHYFYPVVAPDSKGNLVLGFNRSGPGMFAGMFFTGRKATDPPGKLRASQRLAPGLANYKVVFSGTNIGRWGDYNGIALDPVDDTLYVYGEFTQSPEEWGTRVGQITFP